VLRTFGPKREEVAGGPIRLPNEELHNLYASPNIIIIIIIIIIVVVVVVVVVVINQGG
jgi:hypothetical protein